MEKEEESETRTPSRERETGIAPGRGCKDEVRAGGRRGEEGKKKKKKKIRQ